uniref:Uncharacterized protein n=1 Tax=Rangifer tarandus platyrhynchus TaxID=3082113 RepID=A0ACB0DTC5_RANTA|nr:unnamed protein product [Rangifer tarandus platyrhynchus]
MQPVTARRRRRTGKRPGLGRRGDQPTPPPTRPQLLLTPSRGDKVGEVVVAQGDEEAGLRPGDRPTPLAAAEETLCPSARGDGSTQPPEEAVGRQARAPRE